MTLNYNVTGSDRKRLVETMAQALDCEAKYLGAPTFNYEVDYFTIDRQGTITFDDRADSEEVENLIEKLHEAGFTPEGYDADAHDSEVENEVTEVNVTVPTNGLTAPQLRNIIYLAHAKQYLMNKVFGQESWSIDDDLIQRLADDSPTEVADFLNIMDAFSDTCRGIKIDAEQVTLTYPIQTNADKNAALNTLMANMVKAAAEAKRVNPQTVVEENEKYYLRSWLLRVGFAGAEGKQGRTALLDGLKGHTAFRTPADEAKWKAARAAARAAQQAEQEAAPAPSEPAPLPAPLTKEEQQAEAEADAILIHEVNASFEE